MAVSLKKRGIRPSALCARARLCLAAVCLLVVLTGCASVTRQDRVEQRAAYRTALRDRTSAALPADGKVGLQRCIEIAWANNLELELSRLRRRLRELDKDAAFGYFLPQLELSASRTGADKPHEIKAGDGYASMSDQHITQVAVSLQQGIFLPQAWQVYQMQKKGLAIEDLLHQRLRQLIALQVTAQYHGCLLLSARRPSLARGIGEAEAVVREARAHRREGLVTATVVRQAEALLSSRRMAASTNARALEAAQAKLLSTLGVSPFAEVELQPVGAPSAAAVPELRELVAQALLQRLELHAADRGVELRRHDIKRALAGFLPKFGVTGSWSYNSDSFLRYATTWNYGLIAVMTVFDGFRNVAAYKAAKARRQQVFVQREQQCLTIMLEVVAAHRACADARERLQVAQASLSAAEGELGEVRAFRREGMRVESDVLDVLRRCDRARAQVAMAELEASLTRAVLHDVTGTGAGTEPKPKEAEQ